MRKSLLIIVVLAIIVGSCSDDSATNPDDNSYYYEFKEGNEWYYDQILTYREIGNFDTINVIYKVFEGIEKAGYIAYKFYAGNAEEEITPSRIEYGRTERDGLYYFYDSTRYHPKLDATLSTDVWVKEISFTEESWNTLHFEIDTLLESSGERIEIEVDKSGKRIEELYVDYKGKSYKALKCQITSKNKHRYTINNEVTTEFDRITKTEIIIIKNIGIYSSRDLTEGSKYNVFTILKDNKTD